MLWHRRRKTDTDHETLREHTAAHKALHKAEHDLEESRERNQEIVVVVKTAKRYRESNNFTDLIRQALQGTDH